MNSKWLIPNKSINNLNERVLILVNYTKNDIWSLPKMHVKYIDQRKWSSKFNFSILTEFLYRIKFMYLYRIFFVDLRFYLKILHLKRSIVLLQIFIGQIIDTSRETWSDKNLKTSGTCTVKIKKSRKSVVWWRTRDSLSHVSKSSDS